MRDQKRGNMTLTQFYHAVEHCYEKEIARSEEFPTGGICIKPEVREIKEVTYYIFYRI